MKNKNFSKVDLTRVVKDAGFTDTFIETDIKSNNEVATGDIKFEALPCGIDIHSSDIVENINGTSTSEINASLSINILFAGHVSFALENRRFDFKVENQPIVFINVLSGKKLFTRYFNEGRHVKKLNLSVSKAWLIERCTRVESTQLVEQLFTNEQAVYQWTEQMNLSDLATRLFKDNNKNTDFIWQIEHQALQLFSQAFELLTLEYKAKKYEITGQVYSMNSGHNDYEKKIEGMLDKSYSLEQIARELGASISTLQRYFKVHHQLTLKEYIRNQKLEQARRTLIFDNKSIGEAAYLAGYNHVSNFSAAFKKYFSVTPATFQHQYKTAKKILNHTEK